MTRSNPQSLSVYLVFELVRCYLNFQLELQRSLYRYKRSLSVQMRFPIVNNMAEVSWMYGLGWILVLTSLIHWQSLFVLARSGFITATKSPNSFWMLRSLKIAARTNRTCSQISFPNKLLLWLIDNGFFTFLHAQQNLIWNRIEVNIYSSNFISDHNMTLTELHSAQ